MFVDAFKTIEHGAAAKILDQLNPFLDGAEFDSAIVRVLSHPLPFYNGHSLVEVTDHDVNPARTVSLIYKDSQDGDRISILNGKNEVIYALNKSVPIFLNEENISLYVRFFFNYVRGRHGRFLIVETVDEINWKEEPAPSGRKALSKMITPVTLKSVDENGIVSLSNQEMLVEDIPVIDDSFDQ